MSAPRLFLVRVQVEHELVVLATDQANAESQKSVLKILGHRDFDHDEGQISSTATPLESCPEGYSMGALPWLANGVTDGHDPEWSIQDWVRAGAAPGFKE